MRASRTGSLSTFYGAELRAPGAESFHTTSLVKAAGNATPLKARRSLAPFARNLLFGGTMIRIGIVGIGFMGMIHYLAARKLKGAKVTAICSRDPKKLAGDWRSIRGNFGPPGELMDLSKIKKYA